MKHRLCDKLLLYTTSETPKMPNNIPELLLPAAPHCLRVPAESRVDRHGRTREQQGATTKPKHKKVPRRSVFAPWGSSPPPPPQPRLPRRQLFPDPIRRCCTQWGSVGQHTFRHVPARALTAVTPPVCASPLLPPVVRFKVRHAQLPPTAKLQPPPLREPFPEPHLPAGPLWNQKPALQNYV